MPSSWKGIKTILKSGQKMWLSSWSCLCFILIERMFLESVLRHVCTHNVQRDTVPTRTYILYFSPPLFINLLILSANRILYYISFHHLFILFSYLFYYSITSQRPPSFLWRTANRIPQIEREQRSANQRWVTQIVWLEGVKANVVVILFLTFFSPY